MQEATPSPVKIESYLACSEEPMKVPEEKNGFSTIHT